MGLKHAYMKNLTLTLLTAAAFTCPAIGQTNADNTAKNDRDTSGETLTPIDQSNKPADIKITADARKLIVADKSLSSDAKNVKIITIDGVVTLRGPVKSETEKSLVAKYAKEAGASSVTNQIEIVKP